MNGIFRLLFIAFSMLVLSSCGSVDTLQTKQTSTEIVVGVSGAIYWEIFHAPDKLIYVYMDDGSGGWEATPCTYYYAEPYPPEYGEVLTLPEANRDYKFQPAPLSGWHWTPASVVKYDVSDQANLKDVTFWMEEDE